MGKCIKLIENKTTVQIVVWKFWRQVLCRSFGALQYGMLPTNRYCVFWLSIIQQIPMQKWLL